MITPEKIPEKAEERIEAEKKIALRLANSEGVYHIESRKVTYNGEAC